MKQIIRKFISIKYYLKNRKDVIMLFVTLLATTTLIWNQNISMFKELMNAKQEAIVIYQSARDGRIERNSGDVVDTDTVETATQASRDTIKEEINNTPLSVEEQIRQVAADNGFKNEQLLVDIAFCESSLNPRATNAHSSATGLFQILDMHQLTVEERMDVETSTKWTINKINAGGLSAWNASKHCWG